MPRKRSVPGLFSVVRRETPGGDLSLLCVGYRRNWAAVLDARALYPDSSLADLYDELTMPPELRKAHQQNDRAVMAAYGFPITMTESECVARLFELYQKLTDKN